MRPHQRLKALVRCNWAAVFGCGYWVIKAFEAFGISLISRSVFNSRVTREVEVRKKEGFGGGSVVQSVIHGITSVASCDPPGHQIHDLSRSSDLTLAPTDLGRRSRGSSPRGPPVRRRRHMYLVFGALLHVCVCF